MVEFYPEAGETVDLQLWMNKGSTYEENVEARGDVCVMKHGLKIPTNSEGYKAFVARIHTYEEEFRKAFTEQNF